MIEELNCLFKIRYSIRETIVDMPTWKRSENECRTQRLFFIQNNTKNPCSPRETDEKYAMP